MLVQIIVDALEELLTTHIEHELLQHGSALGIGDAVEVDVRCSNSCNNASPASISSWLF